MNTHHIVQLPLLSFTHCRHVYFYFVLTFTAFNTFKIRINIENNNKTKISFIQISSELKQWYRRSICWHYDAINCFIKSNRIILKWNFYQKIRLFLKKNFDSSIQTIKILVWVHVPFVKSCRARTIAQGFYVCCVYAM